MALWTVVATKEQSVLDDNGVEKGNSRHTAAPVGASTNRRLRELIYAPMSGEWPADFYQLREAYLDLTGVNAWGLFLSGDPDANHGASPSVTIRASDAYWVGTGGSVENTVAGWGTGASPVWGSTGTGQTGPTITQALSGDLNTKKSIEVSAYIERILATNLRKRDGTPGDGIADHGVIVKATVDTAGDTADRWGFRTRNHSNAAYHPTFRIYYDPKVPPGVPRVLSPVPGGDPTVVGSATARALTVEFAASMAEGDTADRVELEVYADGATATETDPGTQPVSGTRIAYTGAIAPTPTGALNTFRVATTLPVSAIRQEVLYRVRVRSQKGAWSRWTVLADGRIQTAYIPGVPINPRMTVDPQDPVISATLNSPNDLADGVTGFRGTFLRHNSDGTTTNLWPNLSEIAIAYVAGTTRASVDWGGIGLNDGDVVSWTVSLANRDGVWSPYTAEQTTTMHTLVGPTFVPADSATKLTSRTGPVVINDTVEFDAYRFRLYRNDIFIYGSPITSSGPDDTASITLPSGYLNWGDTFGIEAETRPTSTTEFGPTSPRAYLYIDTLPSTSLTVTDPDGIAADVLPADEHVVFVVPYLDPDKARFGESPVSRIIEVRHDDGATPQAGTLFVQRVAIDGLVTIAEEEDSGYQVLPLTDATGWVGDTNVSAGTVASAPTDYTGNSLRLTFAASATDRGARYTFDTPIDLSRIPASEDFKVWYRVSSSTNLTTIKARWENSPTIYAEGTIFTGPGTLNTWIQVGPDLGGHTVVGALDWSAITSVRIFADVSGSYAGTVDLRDLLIGLQADDEPTPSYTDSLEPEQTYHARARYRDDAAALVSTTLAAAVSPPATNIKVASVTGLAIGQDITIDADSDRDQETRTITAVGTSGSGGEGVDLADALIETHANAAQVRVLPWGPWTPWTTFGYSMPPVVAASSPADAATVTDPTPDFVHTFTSIKAQAYRTLRIYLRTDGVDRQVYERDTDGTGLTETAPYFLLEDGLEYAWDVTGYDEDGLSGTTTRRTFTMDLTPPDAITGLAATTDPVASTVTLTWAASTDPDLAFYTVTYLDVEAQPQRIDLGPRTIDDDRTPLLDTTFTYRGARLGLSTFRVTAHNGVQESAIAEVDATLLPARPGAAMVVIDDERGLAYPCDLTGAPRIWEPVVERFPAPTRRYPAHFHWGTSGRKVTWQCFYIPAEDAALERAFGAMSHLGTAVYLKLPHGYDWGVMRARAIGGPTATPQAFGLMDLSTDFDEIAPEVPA